MSDKKTLILIDGHALAFRQFFALERTNMKNSENQPTWAVYGFFKAIFDLLAKIQPDFIAVAFDVGRQTFRVEKYEEYKKQYGYSDEEIIFVGDDIPDYQVMERCGCPCCPADACSEIKSMSIYVSRKEGGKGVGRDVIEQVLKAKELWMNDNHAFGW